MKYKNKNKNDNNSDTKKQMIDLLTQRVGVESAFSLIKRKNVGV